MHLRILGGDGGEVSPYEIDILLWYHTRAEDHPDTERQPQIWRPTMQRFLEQGLLEFISEHERDATYPMMYRPTDRCRAYCEALCSVPLPEHSWVVNWPSRAATEGR